MLKPVMIIEITTSITALVLADTLGAVIWFPSQQECACHRNDAVFCSEFPFSFNMFNFQCTFILIQVNMVSNLVNFSKLRNNCHSMSRAVSQSVVASSRRSVFLFWFAQARKTAREKIRKIAARGSERTPVDKLNMKRSFRIYTRSWYTLLIGQF